jgi:formylglycine-generating enzyme required for sulfatase activity
VIDVDLAMDYVVVDLSAGQLATNYPVEYLSCVPPGGWTDEYKTTKIVLRRIPAGMFIMGSPANELGRSTNETQHQVTLNRGFYMGVFEVTQKQWERMMGTWPSYYSNASCRDSRPVEQVSYNMIRGSTIGAGWPSNGSVDADSFMGRLQARTGAAFDLPTESQWEYACRAGTTAALNSSKNLVSANECPNMSEVGRYLYNGGSGYTQTGDTSVATAQVGSYLSNAWGLHDMHGNVWEWCLDWYGIYPGSVMDPMGPSSGTKRLYRGGSWFRGASYGRAAFRSFSEPPASISYGIGFRVALPADNRRHLQVILDQPGPYAVSNVLSQVSHTVTAFMDCDGNGLMDDGEPRGSYSGNPLLLTNNTAGVNIELVVPTTGWTMRATHRLAEYVSPGTNTVECEVYFPTNQSLVALGWTVSLPDGWALVSASGDGQPTANPATEEILFSGLHLTNNPVRFTYAVSAPADESGQKTIQATVDYFLTGVGGWEVRMADPDPLVVNPASPYHSSDFRDPKWVIDMQECNRTLSYWRSGGYGVRVGTVDGYAPNESSQDGQRHKADYQAPFWQLDGEEALRVIGYWMAGGYHREASGDDGYAPGMATNGSMGIMDIGDISAMTVAPSTYVPGHHVTLRGTLSYSNDILGLLWKPQLPVGWTILSASANGGTPEVVNNEILFTSKLPPSPLEVTYVCEVPGEMTGDALVRTDVQLMRQGSVNPQSLFGMMAPNMLQLDTDGDGLPDWVETGTGVYRSPTDTGSDPNKPDTDGDGAPDRNEVLSGTNPNQGGDAFRIMGIDALPGDQIMAIGQPLVVRWSSVAGKTYSVSRSTNLVEGFSTIRSNVLATPPANSFIDSSSPEKEVFYLIGVE